MDGEDMVLFWEMWLGITVWMAVSYAFVYFLAAAVSTIMLRKHPWMLVVTIPMLGMFPISVHHYCFLCLRIPLNS